MRLRRRSSGQIERKNMFDGDVLRGQHAVQTFERERALAIKKVRDVGLLKARLLRQPAARQRAAFDAAQKFEAEEFVKILKIHRNCFLRVQEYLLV